MASLLLAVIYVAFISLGLPDSLLGSAWPTMSQDLNVPVAWAGGISAVISMFTIVSALLSDRMTLKFGAGKVTAVSVALTAAALAGLRYLELLGAVGHRHTIRPWRGRSGCGAQ
mgnify:CR=1 FL=1